MPGETFNVLNDACDQSLETTAAPATPKTSIFGAPGGGHVFEDGFVIPNQMSRSKEEAALIEGGGEPAAPPDPASLTASSSSSDPPRGMPKGSPAVPGFDGALSKTPADVMNDPAYKPIPDVNANTFICVVGPCAHYEEMQLGVDKPKDEIIDRPDLWRICTKFHDDEGETSLSDANVPLCSAYSPPWWSVEGQMKKLEVRRRLAKINRLKPNLLAVKLHGVARATMHIKEAMKALRGEETS